MDAVKLTLAFALAGCNAGAIRVVRQLTLEQLVALAEAGVTGSEIWVLYKDKCKQDIVLLQRVLDEAVKCGNLSDALSRVAA